MNCDILEIDGKPVLRNTEHVLFFREGRWTTNKPIRVVRKKGYSEISF